ncbi:SRPBCC domain-containing protein [Rhizobium sp.]
MDILASTDEPVADRQFTITRVYDVPARLLFLAHSKPEHVSRWFGPKGWPISLCEMDFRVGGAFRMQMTSDEGEKGPPFGGTYLEIVPDRKIAYDNSFEEPDSPRFHVTVLFDEFDGRTTLTVTTVFETIAMKEEYLGVGMAEGMQSGFDQLVDVVEDLKAWESK